VLAAASYSTLKGTSESLELAPTKAGLAALKAASGKTLHVTLIATVKGGTTTTTEARLRDR
jgi:hypothetical protein